MVKREERQDYAVELKALRRKRIELAAENAEREQRLENEKAKLKEAQEAERLVKRIEAERRKLEDEQRRGKELETQLRKEAPGQPKAGREDNEQAGVVELGHRQKAARAMADQLHRFVIVRRFFGVDEFRKVEKRKTGVVSKTKELVGFR